MPKKTKQVVDLSEIINIDEEKASEVFDEINIEVIAKDAPKGGLAPKNGGLVAYAAFDCNGEHYEPGDEFNPPAGWTRDANYDEFRGIQIKNSLGKDIGRAFNTPSGLQIVPVKEA